MLLVGLTGGFGSGKSTVATMLKELGATLVDADVLVREVCAPGSEAFNEIVAAFGHEVVSEDGTINRKRLGEIVFSNPASLGRLNRIIHPRVIALEDELVKQIAESAPDAIVVLDVPLLIEAERHHHVDFLVVVDSQMAQRLKRLKEKFGDLNHVALEARMRHQLPLEEKVKLADFVVDNSGDVQGTRRQTERLFEHLVELSAQKKAVSRPQ